jgi:hypothetical protein
MKKVIIAATIIVGCVFSLIACKRSFLEFTPQDGSVTDATRFKTEADFNLSVIGTYAQLQDWQGKEWIINPGYVSQDLVPVSEVPFDLNVFLTPGNSAFLQLWTKCYAISSNANLILAKLETAPAEIPANQKLIMAAEAKFLRGFAYFNLARAFGSVPLITTVFEESQLKISCSAEEKVWDQVIADFKDAAAGLPEANTWGVNNKGRASKGAAFAYLANAYMYKKNWAEAATASQSLLNLSTPKYKLLDDIRDVFSLANENNDESIFEVQYRRVDNGQFQWGSTPNNGHILNEVSAPRSIGDLYAPFGGWGETVVNQKVAAAYEPNDERRTKMLKIPGETYKGEQMTTAITIPANTTQARSAFSTKYWLGPIADFLGGQNIPMMRFSEFLLNYSEILFEQGNAPNAYLNLNLVRKRAKVADLPVSADKATFLSDLMKERRRELIYEPNLWWHYTRTGTASKFLLDNYSIVMKTQWKHYPIPQAELDQNANLCKNGY